MSVWTNETHNSQFETNTRQRKRETNKFSNLGDKKYINTDLFQESWEDWEVDDQHMKRQVRSGKQGRLSNSGKLKSTSQRKGGLDASYDWFGEGFTSAGINSGLFLLFIFLKHLQRLVYHPVPSHGAEILYLEP